MLLGDPLDTLLNLSTFIFIGAMVWLLQRPLKSRPGSQLDASRKSSDAQDD